MGQSLSSTMVQYFGIQDNFRSGWSAEKILLALESNDLVELSKFADPVYRQCSTNDEWVTSQMDMSRFVSVTSSAKINITAFGNIAHMLTHASNPTTLPHLTNALNIMKQMLRVEITGGGQDTIPKADDSSDEDCCSDENCSGCASDTSSDSDSDGEDSSSSD